MSHDTYRRIEILEERVEMLDALVGRLMTEGRSLSSLNIGLGAPQFLADPLSARQFELQPEDLDSISAPTDPLAKVTRKTLTWFKACCKPCGLSPSGCPQSCLPCHC